jgi:pimeloyl-ACP methyl ester carboxylesterase
LPQIADVRSVYAPDLPGLGESDPPPTQSEADAAGAISDLANGLRLRQIDLLGVQSGATAALDLAAARPELVRRLVLVGIPVAHRLPTVKQRALVMRMGVETSNGLAKAKAALPNATFVNGADYADDLFEVAPITLAKEIGAFLTAPV